MSEYAVKLKLIAHLLSVICTTLIVGGKISCNVKSQIILQFILLAIYFGVMIIYRPINVLLNSLKKNSTIYNKFYIISLITAKLLLMVSAIGLLISIVLLPKLIITKFIASKLSILITLWFWILISINYGIGLSVFYQIKINGKKEVIAGVIVSIIGIGCFISCRLWESLFQLKNDYPALSFIQSIILASFFVSIGMFIYEIIRPKVISKTLT